MPVNFLTKRHSNAVADNNLWMLKTAFTSPSLSPLGRGNKSHDWCIYKPRLLAFKRKRITHDRLRRSKRQRRQPCLPSGQIRVRVVHSKTLPGIAPSAKGVSPRPHGGLRTLCRCAPPLFALRANTLIWPPSKQGWPRWGLQTLNAPKGAL
jgi:hypothetical protein